MLYINTKNISQNRCSFYFGLEEYLVKDFNYSEDIFLLWSVKPTVMMGRHQITDLEINKEYIEANNINITRRNSGGGAVFTDPGCLQFSFITNRINHSNIFLKHSNLIVDSVKKLGIDASFTGRNDILSDGLKFSGNAEYIYKEKMVIHGTILFDTNFENLVGSLNPDKVKLTSKAITSVKSRVVNIGTKTDMKIEEFYDFIVSNIATKVIELKTLDMNKITNYSKKFETDEWNYGKNPKFELEKKQKFNSGNYRINLTIKNDKVKDIRITGDYFSLKDITEFEDKFKGIEYTYEAFLKVLKQNKINKYILKMRTSHFLELVFDEYRKQKISKPDYLKIDLADLNKQTSQIRTLLKQHNLHTVCQEANCPNQLECFSQKTATFMILGTKCTRNCKFCDVDFGKPDTVDPDEPANLLRAVKLMDLEHVVITSVTRDDLPDYGAKQFAECVRLIKSERPNTTVEVLIPDLMGDI
ncbi:MAG: lipoate--protein ligase, partial [Candidatus Izemoplasma sp.]